MEPLTETVAEKELSQYQIERGKPMPSKNHSVAQSNLIAELRIHYRKTFRVFSELSLTMPQKPDAVPDIAIYPMMEVDFLHDETSMTQMPLTAIEIVSPSQSNDEILAKFERYFFAGVTSCWMVMPSLKAISVYSQIGVYEFYKDNMTLVDHTTSIELSLSEIFC